MLKNLFKTITKKQIFSILLLFLLLTLNAITPDRFFLRKIGIRVEILIASIFAFITYLNLFKKEKLKKQAWLAITGVTIVSTLVSIFFYWAETNIYPNFTLSKFRIYPNQFPLLPLTLSALSILTVKKEFFKKLNKKTVFFFLPLLAFPLLLIFKQSYPAIFNYIVAEDSIVEYPGFILYLISAFFCFQNYQNCFNN